MNELALETAPLPEVASLWIGPRLSFLEQLCLASFRDAGHPVTLYAYGDVEGCPDGVTLADAREIWDDDRIIMHPEFGSPAVHADIWRIKLLRKTDKIWVDTDAYCLKPFVPKDGYFIGWARPKAVANGIMALPSDSEALELMDEFVSTRGALPPWWNAAECQAYTDEHGAPDFAKLPWGTTGGKTLSYFMWQTGEIHRALPVHVLYPYLSGAYQVALRLPRRVEPYIKDDTVSVHFFGALLRSRLKTGWFVSKSYLGTLCQKHGIDMSPPPGHPSLVARPVVPLPKARSRKEKQTARRVAFQHVLDIVQMSARDRFKYVQVGANDGVLADPLAHRTAKGDVEAVLFEPSPQYFASLERRYLQNDLVKTVNVGVSDTDGEMILFQLKPEFEGKFPNWARGCASLHRENLVSVLSGAGTVKDEMIAEVPVSLRRLDGLLAEHDAADADLLIVDVEGHEPAVFRSFDFTDFTPRAIIYEHVKLNADEMAEIHARFFDAGYRLFGWNSDVIALRGDMVSQTLVDVLRHHYVAEIRRS